MIDMNLIDEGIRPLIHEMNKPQLQLMTGNCYCGSCKQKLKHRKEAGCRVGPRIVYNLAHFQENV